MFFRKKTPKKKPILPWEKKESYSEGELLHFLKKNSFPGYEKKDRRYRFYCAQCRSERHLDFSPHPHTLKRYFQVGLTAGVFAWATSPFFGWKGIVSFLPFWVIFEIYFRIRVRAVMACPNCGFDPYLYMTDLEQTRAAMERHWRAKYEAAGVPFPWDEDEYEDQDGEEEDSSEANDDQEGSDEELGDAELGDVELGRAALSGAASRDARR